MFNKCWLQQNQGKDSWSDLLCFWRSFSYLLMEYLLLLIIIIFINLNVRNIFHSNTAVAVKWWEDKHSKALIAINCFHRKLHRRWLARTLRFFLTLSWWKTYHMETSHERVKYYFFHVGMKWRKNSTFKYFSYFHSYTNFTFYLIDLVRRSISGSIIHFSWTNGSLSTDPIFSASNYMFKVNERDTSSGC